MFIRKEKHTKQENGYGSITKLSGKRRKPFLVRTAATYELSKDGKLLEKRNIIGTFATKKEAAIALAKYNENPYDLQDKKLTFRDMFERFYERKFTKGNKTFSNSTVYCVNGAFRLCESLHNRVFADIKAEELQSILDRTDISYAYLEHVKNLYNQMYKYALQYDIVQKDYSKFVQIAKKDDDRRGVPFTKEELELLWKHKDLPYVNTVLIFIYSGWRVSELLNMTLDNVDLKQRTFQGGIKTEAGKNGIVPILCILFFDVHLTGSILLFLFSYLLVMLSMFSIGMLVGGVSSNVKTANILACILYFPMLIFSGATLPYEIMPTSLQKIVNILPLT